MNRKLLKALDANGFVTIDFPEGSVKVNPDTLQVYTPKGYPAKQRILFGYKASIITFCLGNKRQKTYHLFEHRLVVYLFGDANHNVINKVAGGGSKYEIIDHLDSNKLNNLPENLQIVTKRQNSSKEKTIKSGLPVGVSLDKRRNKYQAKIQINGKRKTSKCFDTPSEASQAYIEMLNSL